jgi:Arc/MetJ family transcription regulator
MLPAPARHDLGVAMKRTNIVLDPKLIRAAKKLSGLKTHREGVDIALRLLVQQKNQAAMIRQLSGVGWAGNFNVMRRNRLSDNTCVA